VDKRGLDSQILQKINQGAQLKEEAFQLLVKPTVKSFFRRSIALRNINSGQKIVFQIY
jgi:hypothetical protein